MSAVQKIFVGLTFYKENSFSKNIESFRTRFDFKFNSNPSLHLAIVPPFEVDVTQLKKLKAELIEELESFYFENLKGHRLKFTGIDVHEYKKNKLLYLRPVIDDELTFCQESIIGICQSYNQDRQKKIKDIKKSFLIIGRFHEQGELHSAIELASKEFSEFSDLPFASICLFSKKNGDWYKEADLLSFEKTNDSFLHSRVVSI